MDVTFQSIYHFKSGHNVAEDLHSTETLSTSDAKSHSSIFSQQNPHLSSYSPYHTTPSHSRSSSHDSDQRQKMEVDFCGIGHLTESPVTADRTAKQSPIDQNPYPAEHDPSLKNQLIPFDYAVNHQTISVSHSPCVLDLATEVHLDKGDTDMVNQDDRIPTPEDPVSSSWSPNQSFIGIGRGLTDSLCPGTPSFDEYLSSSDASSEDEDLDLEKSADEAISRWFGVSLNRLVWPFRVVYAFEQVKRECASILQDEGHYQPDEEDDDEQESQSDPNDTGEGSRSTPSGRPSINKTSSYPSGDKRRFSNRVSKAGSSPDSYVKVRGRNKKHRSEHELSCPYRKRNPNRFNVRDHEQCANKSYPTMSDVKRHLQSHHLRLLICDRCRCPFEKASDLLAHSQQCTAPPQFRTNEPTDPEDGVDQTMVEQLRSRRSSFKIDEWKDLYQALFPSDTTIPDPSFVPVEENYDVLLRYMRARQRLNRNIQDLVARQPLDSIASGDQLREDTMDLFQNFMNTILKCSALLDQDLLIQDADNDSLMQLSGSLENNFIDLTNETSQPSIDLFNSNSSNGTFSAPQYMMPADSQGVLDPGAIQQCLDNSQNMGLLPVYPTLREISETYNYTGDSAAYCDLTNTMVKPSFWSSIPVRHTTSLPGDLQAPMASLCNLNQNFSWAPNDSFSVDNKNYSEAGPTQTFYYDGKDQFPSPPNNHMP